jgi:Ca2+-binding RTX toxin-like protein
MATFTAAEAFDIRTVDLNWYNRNYTGVNLLTNSTHIPFGGGPVYPQVFIFHGDDGFTQRDWVVGGTGMTLDATGTVNGGTVTGMYEEHNPSGTIIDSYALEGISMSAVTVINATLSEDNTDDIAVFRTALAGNDTITLSNFNDNMRGYAGADTIYGRGGSDTLYGDAATSLYREEPATMC